MAISRTSFEKKVFQPSAAYTISAFFGWIFISIFLLFFMGILAILFAPFIIIFGTIYSYLRLKTTFVEIQEEGIQIRAGILFKSQSLFLYSKIQDVQVYQKLVDRLLDLQSISIKTMTIGSAIGGNILGLKKEDSEYIKEFVLAKLNKSFTNKAVNKEAFAENNANPDQNETLKLSPWQVHFFKPLILTFFWAGLLTIILIIIGLIFPNYIFIPIGIICVLFLLVGLGALGAFIKSIAFKYYVGKTRIEIESKFISVNKNTLPIFKIQDVVIFRQFWNRLIGLADVNIETGELLIVSSKNSKQDYSYLGNYIPLLDYSGAVEMRKYVFDALKLNISLAEPALVNEHPLEKAKVIKKTIARDRKSTRLNSSH